MLDFISKLLGKDNNSSKTIAKDRLRLVLVHDRSDISPQIMQELRNDLIKVINNYMEIDENSLEVSLDNVESQVALVANIPVKKMRRTILE